MEKRRNWGKSYLKCKTSQVNDKYAHIRILITIHSYMDVRGYAYESRQEYLRTAIEVVLCAVRKQTFGKASN